MNKYRLAKKLTLKRILLNTEIIMPMIMLAAGMGFGAYLRGDMNLYEALSIFGMGLVVFYSVVILLLSLFSYYLTWQIND